MPMAMFTMENGKMIKPMAMANTTTQMEPDMRDTGSKISSMVKVKRSGQTMPATRENTKTVRSMDVVNSFGLTDQLTPVISSRTIFTVSEFTRGQMGENMMANGKTTRWTEKVSSLGLMAVNTKDNTLMIKKRDRESSPGQTVASMMATGRTGNNMERVFIIQAKEKSKWESGLKANVSTGSMTRTNNELVN